MKHPELAIRSFHPADEAAIIQLWTDCGLTRPWNDPRKDVARKLTVQSDLFLVGEADGAIVGTLMGGYDGHRGWVNYLAVSPAHQRRGYASALMRALERKFLEMELPQDQPVDPFGQSGGEGLLRQPGVPAGRGHQPGQAPDSRPVMRGGGAAASRPD